VKRCKLIFANNRQGQTMISLRPVVVLALNLIWRYFAELRGRTHRPQIPL